MIYCTCRLTARQLELIFNNVDLLKFKKIKFERLADTVAFFKSVFELFADFHTCLYIN